MPLFLVSYKLVSDPNIIPFGSAFPEPALLDDPKLAKSLASVARRLSKFNTPANLPPGNEQLRRNIAQRYATKGSMSLRMKS